MPKGILAVALAALTFPLSLACDRGDAAGSRSEPAPGGAPASASATLTGATLDLDPLASSANRDRVQQLQGDVRLAPKDVALIDGFATQTRASPGGPVLATINATGVTEVARDRGGDHYLVLYPDPTDATKKMAGWVNREAVDDTDWSHTASHAKVAAGFACAAGMDHLRNDHEFCARTCQDDSGCDAKTSQICDGVAYVVDREGDLASSRYCVEGATASTDARGSRVDSVITR